VRRQDREQHDGRQFEAALTSSFRHGRFSPSSQVGALEPSNYVKCSEALWIGGPNFADRSRELCIPTRMSCIRQLSALGPLIWPLIEGYQTVEPT
jgi:hypothetical protein